LVKQQTCLLTGKILVFDIGGTNIKYGLFSNKGRLLKTGEEETPKSYNNLLLFILDNVISNHNIGYVVLGIPGTISYANHKIIFAPNLKYLTNKYIVRDLNKKGNIHCLIENDANLAGIGEYYYKKERVKNFALVTLGTGVGGALINNGKIFTSKISSFELGHMKIVKDGRLCGCGKFGCFEAYASKIGLENTYSELTGEFLPVNDIISKARVMEKYSTKSFQIFGSYLGLGLSNIANLLTPEEIILSGGLSEVADLFFDTTIQTFNDNIYPSFINKIKLSISQLKNRAALFGGYSLAKVSQQRQS